VAPKKDGKEYKALIDLQKGGQTECMFEGFLIQSHLASDFCGSFGLHTDFSFGIALAAISSSQPNAKEVKREKAATPLIVPRLSFR
jgi:hypothetical protein